MNINFNNAPFTKCASCKYYGGYNGIMCTCPIGCNYEEASFSNYSTTIIIPDKIESQEDNKFEKPEKYVDEIYTSGDNFIDIYELSDGREIIYSYPTVDEDYQKQVRDYFEKNNLLDELYKARLIKREIPKNKYPLFIKRNLEEEENEK